MKPSLDYLKSTFFRRTLLSFGIKRVLFGLSVLVGSVPFLILNSEFFLFFRFRFLSLVDLSRGFKELCVGMLTTVELTGNMMTVD